MCIQRSSPVCVHQAEQHRAVDIDEGLQEYTKWLNDAPLPQESCQGVAAGLWRWVSLQVANRLPACLKKRGITAAQASQQLQHPTPITLTLTTLTL